MAELESTENGSRLRGDEAATAAQARGRSPTELFICPDKPVF